jgi:hypothetical protein
MSGVPADGTPIPDRRGTLVAASSPAAPRLTLATERVNHAVLDGGWWPRSWDPAAEVPGLVAALSAKYGRIRQLMLNSGVWEGRFRRLVMGDAVLRLGWFASMDPALLVAITDAGDQIDLLVVPPSIARSAAEQAMRTAADPDNRKRAQHVLAETPTPTPPPARANGSQAKAAWDNEGGSIAANGKRRS